MGEDPEGRGAPEAQVPDPAALRQASRDRYWKSQLRRTALLLIIWAFVCFGMSIFGVEILNRIVIGGMPLGFWMAQQGSIFVFILLILVYTLLSGRADMKAGLEPASVSDSPELR